VWAGDVWVRYRVVTSCTNHPPPNIKKHLFLLELVKDRVRCLIADAQQRLRVGASAHAAASRLDIEKTRGVKGALCAEVIRLSS